MLKFFSLKNFFSSIKFSQNKIIQSPAKSYYEVVSDVSKYNEFLPWCSESKIISQKSANNFDARLSINFKVYKVSYISNVSTKKKPNEVYEIVSNIEKENPIFNFLISKWIISQIDENTCEMNYNIEFEFRNFIYQQVSQYFIDIVGEKMTFAFEKRIKDQIKHQKNINDYLNSDQHEIKIKNICLIPTSSEILESLKTQIHNFYKLRKLNEREVKSLMEILDQNLDLKEFLIQAYTLFCLNNFTCAHGEKKLLDYFKDIILMKTFKIAN